MLIRIPIPRTEHALEFDSDKIDRVELPREMADTPNGKEFTGRCKMILEFANEDAPQWVDL
jgi:hypothetical protein